MTFQSSYKVAITGVFRQLGQVINTSWKTGFVFHISLSKGESSDYTQFRETRCYIISQKDRNHSKRNLSPLDTEFLTSALSQASYCIISTRKATNYLIYWPIFNIYRHHHTPTSKISYEIKSLSLCSRFPDRLSQSGDKKLQRNCATA